jgi:hypothetical protein
MATNQTHHDIRFDFTSRIASMLAERTSTAVQYQRYLDLGTPSTGDGGAACTGQLAAAVSALTEILSSTVGDPDFGAINPVIGYLPTNTATTPTNLGVSGAGFSFKVAHLLPFPLIKLRPVVTGTDVNITANCTFTWTKGTGIIASVAGVASVASVTIAGVTATLSGAYKIVVQNPLDTRSTEIVSTGSIFFTAT